MAVLAFGLTLVPVLHSESFQLTEVIALLDLTTSKWRMYCCAVQRRAVQCLRCLNLLVAVFSFSFLFLPSSLLIISH